MKKLRYYIIIIAFALPGIGCMNANRIMNRLPQKKEYTGWYLGTSNGLFFVIDRGGIFKRNIAFNFGGFSPICPVKEKERSDFFGSPCEKMYQEKAEGFFLLGHKDTTSFDQDVWIYKAKAFYNDYDTTFIEESARKKQKIVYKIKAGDGQTTVKAIWIDGFAFLHPLILYSHCSSDSLDYFTKPKDCGKRE